MHEGLSDYKRNIGQQQHGLWTQTRLSLIRDGPACQPGRMSEASWVRKLALRRKGAPKLTVSWSTTVVYNTLSHTAPLINRESELPNVLKDGEMNLFQ